MRLFRSMKEAPDGLPVIGPSARTLGVRPGNQPTPDVLASDPADLVLPGQGGMSVAPDDPLYLQKHRRPVSLGGTGRDPVWYIEVDILGVELRFRRDHIGHGLIEPRHPLTLQDFQDALSATRPQWKLYCR